MTHGQHSSQHRDLPSLLWLDDAPLFADALQIDRFYDAIASPEGKQTAISRELAQQTVDTLKGKINLEAAATTGKLASVLIPLLYLVNPSLKISAEGEKGKQTTEGTKTVIALESISTPQRQLKQLTLHYLAHHLDRIFLPNDASEPGWRDPVSIMQMPRPLVFFTLPSREEAKTKKVPSTKLIPMAAEFTDNSIVLLYEKLNFGREKPPDLYPPGNLSEDQRREWWREYWNWFAVNYRAHAAILTIEKAASKHGRIRWIDYRLPLSNEGETLHLHVCPSGEYDTGTFAYNLVKRGSSHGIRLVGTLKSGPDLNVLAIYER